MAITITDSGAARASQRYADNALRVLSSSQGKLASGIRVADPSEDAGAAAIGAKLAANVQVLSQLNRNTATGQTVTQFMIGQLQNVTDILTRMLVLSSQSNSDSVSNNERTMLNKEFDELKKQLNSISDNTKWLSTKLLDSATGTLTFQVGLTNNVTVSFSTINVNTNASSMLGSDGNTSSIANTMAAAGTYNAVNEAISTIGQNIATIGAIKSRFKYIGDSLAIELQNTSAAKSAFTDTDVMAELVTLQTTQGLFDMASSMFKQSIGKLNDITRLVGEVAR